MKQTGKYIYNASGPSESVSRMFNRIIAAFTNITNNSWDNPAGDYRVKVYGSSTHSAGDSFNPSFGIQGGARISGGTVNVPSAGLESWSFEGEVSAAAQSDFSFEWAGGVNVLEMQATIEVERL